MATKKEEMFLEHVTTIASASCEFCSAKEENWDEMDLVKNLIKKGWAVVIPNSERNQKLMCPNCKSKK